MPIFIPVLMVGSAIAGAVVGAVKGNSAKKNLAEADRVRAAAQEELERAASVLAQASEKAKLDVERLTAARIEHHAGVMGRFVEVINKINNLDMKELNFRDAPILSSIDLPEISESTQVAKDLISGGLLTVGAGVGAYSGVTALAASVGTASTGTALGSLSGAAATKATMAYFGGGAISAGGLGASVGAVALGALGIGAALGAGGLAAEKYSQTKLTEAVSEAAVKQLSAAEMREVCVLANAISDRAVELFTVVDLLVPRVNSLIEDTDCLVERRRLLRAKNELAYQAARLRFDSRNVFSRMILKLFRKVPIAPIDELDYINFSEDEKRLVELAIASGASLYQVLKVELVDEAGALTMASNEAATNAREMMAA